MSLLARAMPQLPAILSVAGLGLLSTAAGMLAAPAGVAAAGITLLITGWMIDK